jgi:hypothetical protein
MNKWRKKISLAVLTAGLLTLASGAANANSCNPCPAWGDSCDWDFCNMNFEIGADYLWWKPCVDELDYAAEVTLDDITTEVDYKGICPDWEPGYRAYVKITDFLCDLDFCASYTYLRSTDSADVDFDGGATLDEGITSPLIHPDLLSSLFDEAEADWSLTYQAGDALLSYEICSSPCQTFAPFFGVTGIYLHQKLEVDFDGSAGTGSVEWDSDYWGVGLKAGSAYVYRFNDCLSLFAFASGSILAGEADTKNEQEFETDITVEDDDCCLVVPGYHVGLGLIYDTCWCNTAFTFRLGYEFLEWYNLPNHRVFSGTDVADASHSTSASTRTLGFHGLFAGVAVKF